jgi:hypothetical protein
MSVLAAAASHSPLGIPGVVTEEHVTKAAAVLSNTKPSRTTRECATNVLLPADRSGSLLAAPSFRRPGSHTNT